MQANPRYYGGTPWIDRIVFRSYDSVRSAWADMLRGRVDMLYEVGIDAVDSLRPSTQTKVFTFQRPYAFLVFLNIQQPKTAGQGSATSAECSDRSTCPGNRDAERSRHKRGRTRMAVPLGISSGTASFSLSTASRALVEMMSIQLRCLILNDQSQERVGLAHSAPASLGRS